jgi:hypothetical protein
MVINTDVSVISSIVSVDKSILGIYNTTCLTQLTLDILSKKPNLAITRPLSLFGLSCSLFCSNALSYEIKHFEPAIRQANEKLWHQRDPVWQKYCLPIGNGKIGAMVYGGVEQERINFTIDSLWSGKVRPDQNVANTHQKMAEARDLILDGRYLEADELCQASIGCGDGVS